MKHNLVLIPSVVRNPLLSSFLKEEERLQQLCQSIVSAKEKIPNCYIVVMEGGSADEEDDKITFAVGADEVFHYDLSKNNMRLNDHNRSKSYGEMTLFIEYFKTDSFKSLKPELRSMAKLGGRAVLNENFVFDDSDKCFIKWQEKSWSGKSNCCQRYWKVPASVIDHTVSMYQEMRNNFDYVIDIEHGFYQFNVVPLQGLPPNMQEGVTLFVSSYGQVEHT